MTEDAGFNTWLDQRLKDQITWYDKRARQNKRGFYLGALASIIAGALVPVLVTANVTEWIIGAVGALASVGAAVSVLFALQRNWIHYRSVAELLKKELSFFETRSGPFAGLDDGEMKQELVVRVEATISVEHQTWRQSHERKGNQA